MKYLLLLLVGLLASCSSSDFSDVVLPKHKHSAYVENESVKIQFVYQDSTSVYPVETAIINKIKAEENVSFVMKEQKEGISATAITLGLQLLKKGIVKFLNNEKKRYSAIYETSGDYDVKRKDDKDRKTPIGIIVTRSASVDSDNAEPVSCLGLAFKEYNNAAVRVLPFLAIRKAKAKVLTAQHMAHLYRFTFDSETKVKVSGAVNLSTISYKGKVLSLGGVSFKGEFDLDKINNTDKFKEIEIADLSSEGHFLRIMPNNKVTIDAKVTEADKSNAASLIDSGIEKINDLDLSELKEMFETYLEKIKTDNKDSVVPKLGNKDEGQLLPQIIDEEDLQKPKLYREGDKVYIFNEDSKTYTIVPVKELLKLR